MKKLNLSETPYDELLSIYLQHRRKGTKKVNNDELFKLECKNAVSMTSAGRFYLRRRNYDFAVEWLERAGDNPQAQQFLGEIYFRVDYTTPKDYALARKLFMASQSPTSCYNLGQIYNSGLGVNVDKQEAIKWFVQGALQGHKKSKQAAGMLYSEDAVSNRESAKLAYFWLNKSLKKERWGKVRSNASTIALKELKNKLNYDIESLASNYNPYAHDDHQARIVLDESDSNESVIQQEPSSSMATTDTTLYNNVDAQQEESFTTLQQLEYKNEQQARTIMRLEKKLDDYRQNRNDHIRKVERDNKSLKKRIGDLERLFYWIAENDVNIK
ncbi:hypothetical protein K501DRAFT_336205 [Backusella circina FSU 941]|nr:hypothetical protein K501DRAFT_336205 [Backusella circina FSU 941]